MAEAASAEAGAESDEDGPAEECAPDAAASKKKKRKQKKKAAAAAEEEPAAEDAGPEPAAAPAAEQEPEEGSEDGAEAAAPGAKKKKRKPKKKGGGAQDPADAPGDGAAAAAAEEPPAEAASESDEADAGGDAPDAAGAAKKKKRRSKKKAPAAQEADAQVVEGAEQEDDSEAEGAKEDSEQEGEDASAPTKKKKRRPKKKGGAGQSQTGPPQVPDEEFAEWCKNALEATANGTEKKSREELMKPPQPFWGYKYTGSLRPAFVSPQMRMPAGWCLPDYALEPEGVSHSERQGPKEVPILQGKELETMREACRLGREVLDVAARFMRAGVTGDEIDRVVYQACVDRKIYPSPLNYYRFPKTLCVSPNEVICHGIPDARPIEEGDIVNLDVSIYHQGFHSDLNETFFIGECDEDAHRLVRTAYCALYAAAQQIRPGTFYRDLGAAIHTEAAKSNCAVVTTYCGHGVGQLFHGPPKVPHYKKNKAVGIMKPGHVFTVEPMINLGSNGGDRTWPDNWTAVTKDGKRSAQFEHTFLVTEQGLEVLTARVGTDRKAMPAYNPAMFQV